MDSSLEIECQFISAGYNLKQWDLIKQVNQLNSLSEYEVSKTPGTEFLSPIHPNGRQLFSTLVLDSAACTVAALIISNQELYISSLIEGMGFKKIILNAPQCLVFIGLNDNFIAVGSNKGVFIVDTKIPKVIEYIRWPIVDHKADSVTCIDCSHDPKNPNFIAFGTEFGKLCCLTCFRDNYIPEEIEVNESFPKIVNIKFSPHIFSYLVTAHSNGLVNIWDLSTRTIVHSINFNAFTQYSSLDFSPCRNDVLCIGRNDGIISIIDFHKMQKVVQFTIPDSNITGLLFVHNGMDLIVGDAIGQIHIYNLRTMKPSRAYRLHSSTLRALAIKRRRYSVPGIPNSSTNLKNVESYGISDSFIQPNSHSSEEVLKVYHSEHTRSDLVSYTNSTSMKGRNLPITAESSDSQTIISPLRSTENVSDRSTTSKPSILGQNIRESLDFATKRDSGNAYSRSMIRPTPLSKYHPVHDESNVPNATVDEIPLTHPNTELENAAKFLGSHSSEQREINQNVVPSSNCGIHSKNICNVPEFTNPMDYSSFQTLFDNHSSDIKEYFGQQMINLLGELTRNVTNQQIQIAVLDMKLDLLAKSIEGMNKILLQNPHLL